VNIGRQPRSWRCWPTAGRITREKGEADPNIRSLEEDISQVLGTPVEIEPAIAQAGRKKGVPGKLIITFYDNDQLEGVLDGIRRGSRSR